MSLLLLIFQSICSKLLNTHKHIHLHSILVLTPPERHTYHTSTQYILLTSPCPEPMFPLSNVNLPCLRLTHIFPHPVICEFANCSLFCDALAPKCLLYGSAIFPQLPKAVLKP